MLANLLRDNIFVGILETAGHEPYAGIAQATILTGKERRAATPTQARNFLDAMRGLFRWAHKPRLVKADPTVGVDNPARKRNDGFRAWTEEDVAAYEACWPIGTRQRIWLDVLLYTGLRRGDAVRLVASTSATALPSSRLKRANSPLRSLCQSCRCWRRRCQRDHAATCPLFVESVASH
jgi:integrase